MYASRFRATVEAAPPPTAPPGDVVTVSVTFRASGTAADFSADGMRAQYARTLRRTLVPGTYPTMQALQEAIQIDIAPDADTGQGGVTVTATVRTPPQTARDEAGAVYGSMRQCAETPERTRRAFGLAAGAVQSVQRPLTPDAPGTVSTTITFPAGTDTAALRNQTIRRLFAATWAGAEPGATHEAVASAVTTTRTRLPNGDVQVLVLVAPANTGGSAMDDLVAQMNQALVFEGATTAPPRRRDPRNVVVVAATETDVSDEDEW